MSNEIIKILCSLPENEAEYIKRILPHRNTKIVESSMFDNELFLRLYTDCRNVEEVKLWITEFQENSQTFYSTKSSPICTDPYILFKQRLTCFHHSNLTKRTKAVKCPATVNIILHAVKKPESETTEADPTDNNYPCEIYLNLYHNHSINNSFALQSYRVGKKAKEKLISFFNSGHSVLSALSMLKSEIYLCHDNPHVTLADRFYYPSYMYCYHLHTKMVSGDVAVRNPTVFDEGSITDLINKFNEETDGNSMKIHVDGLNYVICVAPPLIKYVHKHLESASKVVFIQSISCNARNSKILALFAQSDCGELPLGIIIASCATEELLKEGFQMLKSILGDRMFWRHPEGPAAFVIDDSTAIQTVIKEMWPQVRCFLHTCSVLQQAWKWLIAKENAIPKERQCLYFDAFKAIAYANDEDGCGNKYEAALQLTESHENYQTFLRCYWNNKAMWTLAHRRYLSLDSVSEALVRIAMQKIFNEVKAFNIEQLVDFILANIIGYYKIKLMDAVNSRHNKNVLGKPLTVVPDGLLERIQSYRDNTFMVSCEKVENLNYLVELDSLMCTCEHGLSSGICKHIDWASVKVFCERSPSNTDSIQFRNILYAFKTNNVPEDTLPANDLSSCIEKGNSLIENLSETYKKFLEESPDVVANALEKMYEEVSKSNSAEEFARTFANFSSDGVKHENEASSRMKTIVGTTMVVQRKRKNSTESRKSKFKITIKIPRKLQKEMQKKRLLGASRP